jgi:glutamate transport system permease protein
VNVLLENLPLVGEGFLNTLSMLGLTIVFALPLGIVLAGFRISPVASLRLTSSVFTEIFRNIPLTLIFFFMVFVLPRLGLVIPDFFVTAVIALTLYTAPFYGEAVRSGVNSVPIGQAEAARSLGLGFSQVLMLVVLPQAVRSVIPPIINVTIALTKNSSVATGFFVVTLVTVIQRLVNTDPAALLWLFGGVALCYLLITITLGQVADRLEQKWRVAR